MKVLVLRTQGFHKMTNKLRISLGLFITFQIRLLMNFEIENYKSTSWTCVLIYEFSFLWFIRDIMVWMFQMKYITWLLLLTCMNHQMKRFIVYTYVLNETYPFISTNYSKFTLPKKATTHGEILSYANKKP